MNVMIFMTFTLPYLLLAVRITKGGTQIIIDDVQIFQDKIFKIKQKSFNSSKLEPSKLAVEFNCLVEQWNASILPKP